MTDEAAAAPSADEGDVKSTAAAIIQRAEALQAKIRQDTSEAEKIEIRIKGLRAEEETEVRKFVTKTVISGYGIVIVGSILLVVLVFFLGGEKWPKELGDWLRDLLLATVLPIVTLVLGYYFGSSSK